MARKLADLLSATGDVKTEHLDKVRVTTALKSLSTKLNFNLGLTQYKTK